MAQPNVHEIIGKQYRASMAMLREQSPSARNHSGSLQCTQTSSGTSLTTSFIAPTCICTNPSKNASDGKSTARTISFLVVFPGRRTISRR